MPWDWPYDPYTQEEIDQGKNVPPYDVVGALLEIMTAAHQAQRYDVVRHAVACWGHELEEPGFFDAAQHRQHVHNAHQEATKPVGVSWDVVIGELDHSGAGGGPTKADLREFVLAVTAAPFETRDPQEVAARIDEYTKKHWKGWPPLPDEGKRHRLFQPDRPGS